MLTLPPGIHLYLATAPVDGRKGIDGLANVVRHAFGADPLSGSRRYGMEQTEGAALWALGTLRPGPEGAADRARLLELIADTGLVDPDRYFWSLMPIGEPPPRRGTTTAIWADAAVGDESASP